GDLVTQQTASAGASLRGRPWWRAAGARWGRVASDHILPGLLYTLATVANVMIINLMLAGQGPAIGLDATERGWLVVQRSLFTAFVGLSAVLFMVRRRRMGNQAGLLAALLSLALHPRDLALRCEVGQRLVPAVVAIAGTNAMALQAFFPIKETSLVFTVPGAVLGAVGLALCAFS